MTEQAFSYEAERQYYARHWPDTAQTYRHLDPYLSCWMRPHDVFAGKRVLDIGAGECAYTQLIAERYKPQQIVACELFRERMLQSSSACGLPNLGFVSGDCFRLPIQSESIDVVFGSLVLHQLREIGRAAEEIARVLTARGLYVGIEPNPYDPKHLFRFMLGRHSGNQFLMRAADLSAFKRVGLTSRVRYFYARVPWLRGPVLTTCMGIIAKKA